MFILKVINGKDNRDTPIWIDKWEYKSLEERGFLRYNDFAYRGSGDWDLTHKGGIPFGKTTLKTFAEIQHEYLTARHNEFTETVRKAWKGIVYKDIEFRERQAAWYKVQLTDAQRYLTLPQPEMIPAALADLNIYRAQLRRVLSAQLYFLEINAGGNTVYKIGVTSRDLSERIVEIEHSLFSHFGAVKIKPLRTFAHRGSIEFYFKHRYKENRFAIGNLTEYFAFDNRKNVLSDLSRLGDYEPDEAEQSIIAGLPPSIEIEMAEEAENERRRIELETRQTHHKNATIQGMQRAKEQGIHVGRPSGTTETEADLLRKYPLVVEAIEQGMPLRQVARYANVSVNTVRKVKNALG